MVMRLTYEPPTTGKLKNLEKTLCLAGRLLLLKIVKIWNIMEVGFLVWVVRRNLYESNM